MCSSDLEEKRCGGEERRRRRKEKGRGEVEEKGRGEVKGEVEERSGGEKGKREEEKGVPEGFKISNPAQHFCGACGPMRHRIVFSIFFCRKNCSFDHNFFCLEF